MRAPALRHRHDAEIWRLALPALGALIAEPLFLLADAAIVGHLGTPQLAGLAVAAAVLSTLVSLCVFLAYGTTASVARRIGADDLPGAVRQGVDGIWLGALLGLSAALVGVPVAGRVVQALGASASVAPYATTYLRISLAGAPAMLIVLAATGVLRGLQDTRTPLVVAGVGAVVNVALNLALVYGVGLGIAGSALGTVLTQTGSAAAFLTVVVRGARQHHTRLRPDVAGIRAAASAGVPLVVRTMSLRLVFVVAVVVASRLGDVPLAAHQVAYTLWTTLALALDAIAIAAQALVGRYLGAGDVGGAREFARRMIEWGAGAGLVLGVLLTVLRPAYVPLFSTDEAVRSQLMAVLLVAAVMQPVCGVVFVLDGVLIGAGDGRYLAWAGLGTLAVFLPFALAVPPAGGGLVALWWALVAFLVARCVFLLARERSDAWLVTGASARRERSPRRALRSPRDVPER